MEDNKLIADFMGWEQDTNQGEGEKLYFQPHDTKWQQMRPSEMLFNASWDWLIPVVDKCYQDGRLYNPYRMEIVASLSGVIDIEDTYYSVVDFIKNQNDKKL
tara:strand:- start:142 stop:447 length:306 start_codon:yes stop_codon:yes gene_type:complete